MKTQVVKYKTARFDKVHKIDTHKDHIEVVNLSHKKDGKSSKHKALVGNNLQVLAWKIAKQNYEIGIEIYWKCIVYFGSFVVVIFTASFFFCFRFLLKSIASNQWQKNWKKHADLLEDEVVRTLYKLCTQDQEENFSAKNIIKWLYSILVVVSLAAVIYANCFVMSLNISEKLAYLKIIILPLIIVVIPSTSSIFKKLIVPLSIKYNWLRGSNIRDKNNLSRNKKVNEVHFIKRWCDLRS